MQPQSNNGPDIRGGFHWLYLLVSGHATCMTVFTRHSFGVEALGANGLAALGVIFAYLCYSNSPAVFLFGEVWFVALALQRIVTFIRVRFGWRAHSRYEGYPWLGFLVPFVRREDTAKIWEAFVCFPLGSYLCQFDQAVGHFVFLGFFSLLFKTAINSEIRRKRLQNMRDAEIEMQQLLDRFKQRNS
ncbi:MAG TPA: hypothetical protein VGN12_06825 [Pirellulales bacterium]|jgi:hypothetical protein